MIESKVNRILKLEKRQTASDQKEIYCSCICHRKTLGDYMIITPEYAEKVWEIMEEFGSYQRPDGTRGSRAEDIRERIKNRPPCTCKCKH